MVIDFENNKDCSCYRDLVLNPVDRQSIKNFGKRFDVKLIGAAVKVHNKLTSASNASIYNLTVAHDNKIHRNDEIFEGNLDLPKSKITKKEQEANAFAFQYLFNGNGLRKWLFRQRNQFVDYSFVDTTSAKFNVPKIFVAYWMKKAFIKTKTVNDNLPNVSF